MKDGSPQVSPVWANYEDGYILVNTAEGRIKHKNVLRDPRVAVSVVSKDNPLDMTTIRGTVEELISDYEYKHADKLTFEGTHEGSKEVVPENTFVKIGITAKNISNEKTLLTGGQFYIVDEK